MYSDIWRTYIRAFELKLLGYIGKLQREFFLKNLQILVIMG